MVKFSDEHKVEGGKYFELGVHKVQIAGVEFGKTEDKEPREYVEFTVVDDLNNENAVEAKARLWFTTDKAIKYTFGIIRGIFVHNAPEDKKQAIREKVDAVKDTDELDKLCQLLIGKEAWLEVSEDATRTYQNEAGETKPSINRNITGYEPTPKKVSAPAAEASAAPVDENGNSDDVMADF
jgi:hypothetical protein